MIRSIRVVNQALGNRVPIKRSEFQVDTAAAFPEEDAEWIDSIFRDNHVKGSVRVVEGSSILAAWGITETEECAQRVPWIRSGNARPAVVHVQAKDIRACLEVQVGLEFMHGVVHPEIRSAPSGHAWNLGVGAEYAAIRP